MKRLANGFNFGSMTLDAGGVDVGDSDPFPADGSGDLDGLPDGGDLGKTVSSLMPTEGGVSKCILDGLEIDCARISGNASAQCPNNDCGTRTVTVTARSRGRVVASSTFIAPTWWDDSLDGTYSVNSTWAGGFSFGTSQGGHAFISELTWRSAMGAISSCSNERTETVGHRQITKRECFLGTRSANLCLSGICEKV